MASKTAKEIIQLYDREYGETANFRTVWQETANVMFPRENQITTIQTPGLDKSKDVYDDTAEMASQDMASGLSNALIPWGEKFFDLVAKDKPLMEIDRIRRYLALATDRTHEELFEANFMLQYNETLRSKVVFGTGNPYSEWDKKNLKLNFKDWDIAMYQFLENSNGIIDTMLLKFPYTARQAEQEFGDKVGDKVKEALSKPETENKVFHFIHYVAPRTNINPNLSRTYNLNMPWESVFVCVEEEGIVDEGGFDEFPFHTGRWMKSSCEKWGRGQGTKILSTTKTLQQVWQDYIECGNKRNNPPLEVLSHFEGQVRVTPGACNFVQEKGTIRGFERQAIGDPVSTKEILEMLRQTVGRAFYKDIFAPLTDLTGDRRNELEIMQRIKEAMGKLSQPIYREQSETLSPMIKRSVLLLIRNGVIPYPPPELQGRDFGIEYVGSIALALRNQKAKGFMQWVALVGEMEAVFPGVKDNIDEDKAVRRMGRAFGVHEEDIATEEERDAKRQARQQAEAALQAAQAAQVASEAYQKTQKAPESGSPAEMAMAEV